MRQLSLRGQHDQWSIQQLVAVGFFLFYFVFKTIFKTTLLISYRCFHRLLSFTTCFHFFTISFSLFHSPNHFTTVFTSPISYFTLPFLLSCFFFTDFKTINTISCIHCFHRLLLPSLLVTVLFFSLSLTKKNLLTTNLNELLMLLSPPIPATRQPIC